MIFRSRVLSEAGTRQWNEIIDKDVPVKHKIENYHCTAVCQCTNSMQ